MPWGFNIGFNLPVTVELILLLNLRIDSGLQAASDKRFERLNGHAGITSS